MQITADIMDYLGKYENGVLLLLNINFDGNFSEGSFYYTDKMITLTVDESIEKEIGCPIELWTGYKDLVVSILEKVVPYNEIINRLDEVDFSQYFSNVDDGEVEFGEDVDEDDIKSQS